MKKIVCGVAVVMGIGVAGVAFTEELKGVYDFIAPSAATTDSVSDDVAPGTIVYDIKNKEIKGAVENGSGVVSFENLSSSAPSATVECLDVGSTNVCSDFDNNTDFVVNDANFSKSTVGNSWFRHATRVGRVVTHNWTFLGSCTSVGAAYSFLLDPLVAPSKWQDVSEYGTQSVFFGSATSTVDYSSAATCRTNDPANGNQIHCQGICNNTTGAAIHVVAKYLMP